MRLEVIYEDNHLIAVNKPAGALVQHDRTGDFAMSDLVKKYIKDRYNKPGDVFLGTIHRLDRPVSGVTIYARTSKGLSRMNELMRDRKIEKEYLALTKHCPPADRDLLVGYIEKNSKKNKVNYYDKPKGKAKKSETEYILLSRVNNVFCLGVKPKTGRPHQIRVQLSRIGCPLIGDLKYGDTVPLEDRSIGLHCCKMAFEHPVKKVPVSIHATPPFGPPWDFFDFDELLTF